MRNERVRVLTEIALAIAGVAMDVGKPAPCETAMRAAASSACPDGLAGFSLRPPKTTWIRKDVISPISAPPPVMTTIVSFDGMTRMNWPSRPRA